MRRRSIAATTFSATILWVANTAGPNALGDEFDVVRQRISNYTENEGVPSISVAAIRDCRVLWLESFGWADVESQVAATPDTPYMLASTSKPITATAVMVAAEQGCLKLDADVNRYLATTMFRSRVGDAAKITVRDVLTHRSGLPNYNEAYFIDEGYRPPSMNGLIRRYGWTMMPHGEFHYSNLAFSSLAQVITNATQRSFPSFVKTEVFDPLRMHSSSVADGGAAPSLAAVRYGEKSRLRDFSTSMAPAAEIYSSARDLARFAIFHLKKTTPQNQIVLSANRIDEMQNSATPIRFFNYRYALGWSIGFDKRGRRHVFHGGGFAGCDTFLALLPDQRVADVFLSNKNRRWPGISVSQDIVERTLAALVHDEREQLSIDYDRQAISTSDRGLQRVAGVWDGSVTVDDDKKGILLRVDANGDATAAVDGGAPTKIENPEIIGDAFFGTSRGTLQADASRLPGQERLDWDLRLSDNTLNGVLYVNCPSEGNGYLLPYWVELRRPESAK